MLAHRIASWATDTSAFSPSQKGFLAYDGCAEHNFVLQALLTDTRRQKRDLMLAWLDLCDAFGSVPHELLLLMMERLGLSGGMIAIVRDIYHLSTIAVRMGHDFIHHSYPTEPWSKAGLSTKPTVI